MALAAGGKVRDCVARCPKNCWMVGTASPVMHKYMKYPMRWAVTNKLRSMRGLKPCLDKTWHDVGQNRFSGATSAKILTIFTHYP